MLSFTILATLFFLSCSITSSLSVILYFIVKKDVRRISSRLMISMACADLLGATFWLADIMHSVCPEWMLINLYGYQAAQCWSCVIGIHLSLKFSQRKLPPEILFHAIAWIVPFIPQAIIISQKMYKDFPPPQGCWLEFGQAEMLVVAIPQGITVVVSSVCLGIIFIHRGTKYRRWGFQERDTSLLLIQICCLITTFASILQSIPNAPSTIYNISYILGASQGLFNALSMRQRMVLKFIGAGKQRLSGMLHRTPVNNIVYAPIPDQLQEEGLSASLLAKKSGPYNVQASEIN